MISPFEFSVVDRYFLRLSPANKRWWADCDLHWPKRHWQGCSTPHEKPEVVEHQTSLSSRISIHSQKPIATPDFRPLPCVLSFPLSLASRFTSYTSSKKRYRTLPRLSTSTVDQFIITYLAARICMNSVEFYGELIDWILNHVTDRNMVIVQSVATCSALIWLLFRAWQTLWKPVPELISILGVEVPDAPDVSLAGIKSDSITLHLSRPEQNKPVTRYLIQVNGVNVGDSQPRETAITITGLRPGHFYNVRVIAVGANNFQAGSQVIRLRTFGRNGRPILEDCRKAPGQSTDNHESDSGEEPYVGQKNIVGIEAATLPEGSHAMAREQSSGGGSTNGPSGQRRNTGGRKHSPSTTSADPMVIAGLANKSGESMYQLTEKLSTAQREKDEITTQISRDGDEFKSQITDMTRERDEKRQILKEKEEASEKLKKEVHYFERLNRQAQNKKSQKEKVLKEKQIERSKMQEDMIRWKKEIEDMKAERECWREERENLDREKEKKLEKLRETIRKRQNSLIGVEEEIRIKGLQIKELEAERKNLPGAEDDEESQLRATRDEQEDQEWVTIERNLVALLNTHSQQLRDIQATVSKSQKRLSQLQATNSNLIMYHGNSSGIDFDPAGSQTQAKSRRTRSRRSRTSTISSPIAAYPIGETQFPSARAYNSLNTTTSPSFAPGPYIDLSNDTAMVPLSEQMTGMSEEDMRGLTAGAPLSPTATALLPSNIFADDDPPSPRAGSIGSFGPAMYGNFGPFENDPQSPESSSRSASLMSSPQNSSQNLSMHGIASRDYGENERTSVHSPRTDFGAIGSPITAEQSTTHKGLRDLFTLPRARGKTMQDGPALGSLKQGQSQSFPRSVDEPETMANRHRRISFSSGWPSFLQRASTTVETPSEGNGPAPARNVGARRRRGFNVFSSSDEPGIFPDRDPSSPRPLSVASSDLPRPSTDSAPFGWAPAQDNVVNRNSPLATNWSVQHQPQPQLTWSTNPSRRPSFQHGSSAALTSGVASDDDEFLPPSDALGGHASPPPAIGVIGTRPSSSHKPITPKLNPAAPAFKGFSFNRSSKSEKDKGKGKGKAMEPLTSLDEPMPTHLINITSSPPDSRKSRDTPSIRTQNSTAESHESLEQTSSNTPSELATPSGSKDKDSAFRQLLRKGSSSKFSISSFRNKDSNLFGGKKGGSATNSDRNASVERDGSFDENSEDHLGRSVDSVTSSPMIGSVGSGEWKGREKEGVTPKEGRMSMNWGRFALKKGKGRESMDNERSEPETLGTEDEV